MHVLSPTSLVFYFVDETTYYKFRIKTKYREENLVIDYYTFCTAEVYLQTVEYIM